MKNSLLGLVLAATVFAFVANAQDINMSKAQLTSSAKSLPAGLVPFVGAGLGYTDYSKHADIEGTPSALKLLGSYYSTQTPLVFDLGLGLNSQKFSQGDARDRNVSGAQIELAARYNFANRWQAGLVGNTLFNQGDSYSANQADLQLAGVQALKEFNVGTSWIARVGGRVLTGLNTNEKLNMAMIDLQLGWSSAAAKSASMEQAQVATMPANSAASRAMAVSAPAPALMSVLANEKISSKKFLLFQSNKSSIATIDQAKLKALARKLSHSEAFGKLQIIGHADITGKTSKNDSLSMARSESVAKILTQAGLPATKIVKIAKGDKEPAVITTNKQKLSANRRVQLKFIDVKDEAALTSILSSL